MFKFKKDQIDGTTLTKRCTRALDNIPVGCLIISFDWRYLYVNHAAALHGNQPREELLGAKMMERHPGIENADVFKVLRRCMQHRVPQEMENEFVYPDGSKRWFKLVIQPDPEGIFISSLDITDQKRTNQEQSKLKQQLSNAVEMAHLGYWEYDVSNDLFIFNDQFYKIFRTTVEQAGGYKMSSTDYARRFVHPDDSDMVGNEIRKCIETSDANFNRQLEHRILYADGEVGYISVRYFIIKDDRGDTVKTYGVNQDITYHKRTREALRKKDAMMANIASQVPGMLYQFKMAPDGGYSVPYSSKGVKAIFGCSPEDVKNDFAQILNAIHPEDRSKIQQTIDASIQNLSQWKCEYRVRLPGQPIKWIFGNSIPEQRADGSIIWSGYNVDITERKLYEQEIQDSEKKLKYILDSIPDMITEVDSSMSVLWANRTALNLNPDAIGQTCHKAFPGVKTICKGCYCRKAFESGKIEMGVMYQPDSKTAGESYWENIGVPLKDQDGNVSTVLEISRNITERKQAEKALEESERKFRGTFEQAAVGICHTDIAGKFLRMNRRFAKIVGYSQNELLALKWQDITHSDDIDADLKKVQQVLDNQITTYSMEKRFIHKNESIVWAYLTVSLLRAPSGEPQYFIGVIEDITYRKKIEKQLQQAQKMESIGRLAGGIAHDFNNMLSVILGNAEMILEDINPIDSILSNVEEIRKAANRSADLTRQLLAFARKQTIAPQALDLNRTIGGMLKMLRRLIGEDIDLLWRPKSDLGSIKIDPSQVDQILANLCVNARDSIQGAGKITIETQNVMFDHEYCRNHEGFNPGEYIMIGVSDNGVGMDRDTQKKIFEPFFSTKDIGQGTGLGLSMVYGIVKQNKGFINVYSEMGKGTTFKVYLPKYITQKMQSPKKAIFDKGMQGNETILLVEDEDGILRMTTMMLERFGYKVLPASSPDEAIRMGESHPGEIQLLMTDVVMPAMSGREVAETLLQSHPNLKCLFMSGYTDNVIAHHGVLEDGVSFISKPFSRHTLGVKIREILNDTQKTVLK